MNAERVVIFKHSLTVMNNIAITVEGKEEGFFYKCLL